MAKFIVSVTQSRRSGLNSGYMFEDTCKFEFDNYVTANAFLLNAIESTPKNVGVEASMSIDYTISREMEEPEGEDAEDTE